VENHRHLLSACGWTLVIRLAIKTVGFTRRAAFPTRAQVGAQPISAIVACASKAGERKVFPAETSAGVTLVQSTGVAACLLGKTWGYDDYDVWVSDGCGGEFSFGQSPKHFGTYTPGVGFTVPDTEGLPLAA
jgi:hypothetical protein